MVDMMTAEGVATSAMIVGRCVGKQIADHYGIAWKLKT